ncbi:hypothetical protein [Roseovarius sp. THAF8]|uniref:hypothetical protein n=1 Tax=Roseovarius sp. THAF8 TaxID=2587846 RepID=UPI001561F49C|nr:hypothetical protein [Roseovarius sp. THAF8]
MFSQETKKRQDLAGFRSDEGTFNAIPVQARPGPGQFGDSLGHVSAAKATPPK